MIDTTSIGYSIFYTYGFIQEKRFTAWRAETAPEDPTKTNEQYSIDRTEKLIARGREEAEKCGIVPLYDEWIEMERAYFARCLEERTSDEDLQQKRLSLAQKVKLRSMEIED